MHKKKSLKVKRAEQSNKEEIMEVVFTCSGIGLGYTIKIIHLTEIITPQPYSVFALCKLYEYFQRN